MLPPTFTRLAEIFALLFVTSFSPWAAGVASAPTPGPQLDLVARLGGNMTSVAVRGSLAYIGQGATFTVLDISNLQQITQKGTLAVPDQVNQIRLAGSLALLGTSSNGMLIIDISDPAHPWFRERYPFGVAADDLAVEGHLGYLLSRDALHPGSFQSGPHPHAELLEWSWFWLYQRSGSQRNGLPGLSRRPGQSRCPQSGRAVLSEQNSGFMPDRVCEEQQFAGDREPGILLLRMSEKNRTI
jgi:hypothetical protein